MKKFYEDPADEYAELDRTRPKHSGGIRCGLCGRVIADTMHLDIFGDTYHISCYVHEYGRTTFPVEEADL